MQGRRSPVRRYSCSRKAASLTWVRTASPNVPYGSRAPLHDGQSRTVGVRRAKSALASRTGAEASNPRTLRSEAFRSKPSPQWKDRKTMNPSSFSERQSQPQPGWAMSDKRGKMSSDTSLARRSGDLSAALGHGGDADVGRTRQALRHGGPPRPGRDTPRPAGPQTPRHLAGPGGWRFPWRLPPGGTRAGPPPPCASSLRHDGTCGNGPGGFPDPGGREPKACRSPPQGAKPGTEPGPPVDRQTLSLGTGPCASRGKGHEIRFCTLPLPLRPSTATWPRTAPVCDAGRSSSARGSAKRICPGARPRVVWAHLLALRTKGQTRRRLGQPVGIGRGHAPCHDQPRHEPTATGTRDSPRTSSAVCSRPRRRTGDPLADRLRSRR